MVENKLTMKGKETLFSEQFRSFFEFAHNGGSGSWPNYYRPKSKDLRRALEGTTPLKFQQTFFQ
jgi:hypothetical protein